MDNKDLESIKASLYDALDKATKSTSVFDSNDPATEIDIEFDIIETLKKSIIVISKAIERNNKIYS